MSSFSVKFDAGAFDAELDAITAASDAAVRPAAQAGAQVLYDEVLLRVPVAAEARRYKGKTYAPGTLKASIYQKYSTDNSTPTKATYHISWNHRKAPHGHLIENGHWTKSVGKNGPLRPHFVPAHSFIRSSFDAKVDQAMQAASVRYDAEMSKSIGAVK